MDAVGFGDRAMCIEECDWGAKRNETQCKNSSTVKRNEAEHNIIKLMV